MKWLFDNVDLFTQKWICSMDVLLTCSLLSTIPLLYTHAHTNTRSLLSSILFSHTHTHTHTHSLSLSCPLAWVCFVRAQCVRIREILFSEKDPIVRERLRTVSFSFIHTHTHAHSYTLTQTFTRTHTQTWSKFCKYNFGTKTKVILVQEFNFISLDFN